MLKKFIDLFYDYEDEVESNDIVFKLFLISLLLGSILYLLWLFNLVLWS